MKPTFTLGALVLALACACTKSPGATTSSSSSSGGAATSCPSDLTSAIGKPCAPDGATCGKSPSGFTHFIMCSNGKWGEMEAPPPPPPSPTSS